MAKLIEAGDIARGWLCAMEHLISVGGRATNLVIAIDSAGHEQTSIRSCVDRFLDHHGSPRVRRVKKVADTIFPMDFYGNSRGPDARQHLYNMQAYARQIEERHMKRGTYFDRLVNWPAEPKPINQLELKVEALQRARSRGVQNGNAYELALAGADEDEAVPGDLRIQDPARDPSRQVPGFPCLSHISLTLSRGRLHLTALYRNQHFITKAYGNLVGLSDLLRFLSLETDYQAGELVCVSTHADAEFGKNRIKKADILDLVSFCRESVGEAAECSKES